MRLPLALRRAVRGLLANPGITVLATLALGLGIGLPTAMFSIVDAAVFRGLPIPEPHRLMHLERRPVGTAGEGMGAAPRDFHEWVAQQRSFTALGAYRTGTVALRDAGPSDRWQAAYVTPNSFRLLGVSAERGRAFGADDAPATLNAAVVLGHHVWRDRFASDPAIIGKTVWVDGAVRTVVGVMPADFRFPYGQDVWLPLDLPASADGDDDGRATVDVFGTLRSGVSREQARAEFALIARRMAAAYPATNRNLEVTVKPFAERWMGETATSQLRVLLGAVLLVLVVACANVANLLLVRTLRRSRELVVGVALGASRGRLMSELLLESALLAAAGVVFGVAVAAAGVAAGGRIAVDRLPYWAVPRLDGAALLFAITLGAAAALAAGVLPALRATRADPAAVLRDETRGSTGVRMGRVMRVSVVVELALAMALVATGALLARGARRASSVDLGFPAQHVVTAQLSAPERVDSAGRAAFFDEVERRVREQSTVTDVGLATALPGTHAPARRVAIEGATYARREDMPSARVAAASAGFFPALRVAATQGRLFGGEDRAESTPVAIVNARFAERYLPNGNPVGRRIRVGRDSAARWLLVVGVVPNLWMGAFDAFPDANPAGVYVPLAQAPSADVGLVVRTRGDPMASVAAVRGAVAALDRDLPLYDVRRMGQVVADGTWFYGMIAVIVGVCGVAALLLATAGVYGVLAFAVGERRREFGIRMAFGASASGIVRLVLRRSAPQVAIGLVAGGALALLLARGVESLLFQGSPSDLLVYAQTALALAVVSGCAMLVPALAAARTQPVETIRRR